jgi:hypothetical protein
MQLKHLINEMPGVRLARNPSRRASVLLGLRLGIFYAPLSLVRFLAVPALLLGMGLIAAIVMPILWLASRLLLLLAGLNGDLTEENSQN